MPFVSTNPATGEIIATIEDHRPEEVERRLALAQACYQSYRHSPLEQRSRWLITAAELLEGEMPTLAADLTAEMGKTFSAAKGEIAKCAMALRFYAEHGPSFLADEAIASSASRSGVRYDPIGPVLAVMPWNFPLWQVIRFAAPALMAGNVGLLKHASNVGQTALYLEHLFTRAGFPDGAFQTLMIPSSRVADVIRDERVVAVTLTGSEAAGAAVASVAGSVLKKCVLELGGADPFVVMPSADLDLTGPAAAQGRVQNNGQSCIAAKRFIVTADRAEDFLARFVTEMQAHAIGDPMNPSSTVGPLVSEAQRDEVEAQVDDALAKGATLHCGGKRGEGPGFFYPPTILSGVTKDMRAGQEEIFGPVAVVYVVDSIAEAIELANDTPWGLGASVWASDPAEQQIGIDGIDAGMVFVNSIVASTPELPFGGTKRSGYGRELSVVGMREFMNAKTFFVA